MRRRAAAVILALALLALASPAGAHTRSMSFSRWTFDEGGASVELKIPLLELTRFDGGDPSAEYFAERLVLIEGETPCEAYDAVRAAQAPDGWAIYRWKVRSGGDGAPRRIHSEVLAGIVSTHAHFARIESEGAGTLERVLTAESPDWALAGAAGAARGSSIGDYILLGLQHILEGWDHLAFVLALILMAGSLKELATIVTGFTVAHSLTLGLAALEILKPDTRAVEIHIGFSIALVAAENLWLAGGRDRFLPWGWTAAMAAALIISSVTGSALAPFAWAGLAVFSFCHFRMMAASPNPARLRALVSFAFGLVHGFGFAGVLMDMELPRSRLLPGLLGFNLGVEAGQLLVVAMAWPVLLVLGKLARGKARGFVAVWGSAALLAFGVFWMALRNWG